MKQFCRCVIILVCASIALLAAASPLMASIDICCGQWIDSYVGETSPAETIADQLAAGYKIGFDEGEFRSSTANSDCGLGWIDRVQSQEIVVAYTLYGDATLDGKVDISDLAALGQNWNGAGKIWAQGDANYNGKVDISDLAALGKHWNQSVPDFGFVNAYANPEPSTLIVWSLLGLAAFACRFWRHRKAA